MEHPYHYALSHMVTTYAKLGRILVEHPEDQTSIVIEMYNIVQAYRSLRRLASMYYNVGEFPLELTL